VGGSFIGHLKANGFELILILWGLVDFMSLLYTGIRC